jgi:hypothetical protein
MGADRPKRKRRGGSIDIAWEDEVRRKLQASGVLNRLISYVNGEITLETSQVTAALGLLRKCLPDLATVEHKGEVATRYVVEIPAVANTPADWQQLHVPPPHRVN